MGRIEHKADTSQESPRRKRRKRVILLVAAVLTVGPGTAYAYWTTVGAGTGAGAAGTNTALTVTQDSTVTGLAPGGGAKDIDFTINNSAANPQWVGTVTIAKSTVKWLSAAGAGSGSTLADHPAGATAGSCSLNDFTVSSPITVNANVPANGTLAFTQVTSPASGQISMTNTGVNQDDCKTATVGLTFTIS